MGELDPADMTCGEDFDEEGNLIDDPAMDPNVNCVDDDGNIIYGKTGDIIGNMSEPISTDEMVLRFLAGKMPKVTTLEEPADEDLIDDDDDEEDLDGDDEDDAVTLGFDDTRDPEERADGYPLDEETGVVACECAVWPCRHNCPRGCPTPYGED